MALQVPDDLTQPLFCIIRLALRARKMNTATMARELGLPSATLDGFIAGKNSLPPETLAAIVRDLFHGAAVFDPAIDRLRSSNTTEPVSPGR